MSTPIKALKRIENYRDNGLSTHSSKVSKICEFLGLAVGLDEHFRQSLEVAAALHDIGKLTIADSILLKPGALSPDEMIEMQTHAQIGHDILREVGDPILDFAASVAQSHHECFDGTGYPLGLVGEEIPLGSRIVALCDVYDALRADRAYRAGMNHADALSIITGDDGRASRKKFDPTVLDAFVRRGASIGNLYEAE